MCNPSRSLRTHGRIASGAIFRSIPQPLGICAGMRHCQSAPMPPIPCRKAPLGFYRIERSASRPHLLHWFCKICVSIDFHGTVSRYPLSFCSHFTTSKTIVVLHTIVLAKQWIFFKGANFAILPSTHISIGAPFLHRLCPMGTFGDIFLKGGIREIDAAVWHILNIRDYRSSGNRRLPQIKAIMTIIENKTINNRALCAALPVAAS